MANSLMKKIFSLFTAILLITPTAVSAKGIIGPIITASADLPLTEGYVLLAEEKVDLNGDGIDETLFLEAKAPKDSAFAEDIKVRLLNNESGKTKDFSADINGYGTKFYITDFTGDGVSEIMLVVETGGSGGTVLVYVIDFSGDKPAALLSAEDSIGVKLESARYLDGYKAELTFDFAEGNERTYTIDLSSNKENYEDPRFQIYDEKGKLLNEVEPFIDPYGGVVPYANPYEPNQIQIECLQRISGAAHYDTIAYLMSRLEYRDGKFVLAYSELKVPAYGNEF